MSGRSNNPELNLKPNSPPPRANNRQVGSPNKSVSSWEISPESSCVSLELDDDDGGGTTSMTMVEYPSSVEATTAMALVGCPRCLMYVMLSEVDPKCPRCKSTVLLDFLKEENAKRARN